jgi:hypothetical protein
VGSTWRQFKRYVEQWRDDIWKDIANKAIQALNPEDTPETEFDYPEDE